MKWTVSIVASLLLSVFVVGTATAQCVGPNCDHLKCYKVKDSNAKVTYTANVNGLSAENGCLIKVPGKLFCVPAQKTTVSPLPPGGGATGAPNRFVCYKLKCPKATQAPITIKDQFGTRSVQPGTAKYLCAPAPSPTPTTTTTVTTTTTLGATTTVTTTTAAPTTSTTVSTTTTTGLPTTSTTVPCCSPVRITTNSSSGILLVSTLAPFPFPAGVTTVVDSGAAPGFPDCTHPAIVPAGGFTVPVFCIPALGFTSQVTAAGCESGGADGAGRVWDNIVGANCPDADVFRVGDTTDPDGGGPSCGTLGVGCTNPVTPGSAGDDTKGNIDTTRGNGICDLPPSDGVGTQLDIPVNSLTWNDADGNCPDDDGAYDPGTDILVTQFKFILSPTTGSSNADYTDLNGDSCSFAGNGPDHTKHCSLDSTRPCASNGHCTNPPPNAGTCVDGPINGITPAGPCCVVGQTTTVVATGIAFTGGAPLYDILFANKTPSSITSCGAFVGGSCTVTTDPCLD